MKDTVEILKLMIESGENLSEFGKGYLKYLYFRTATDVLIIGFLFLFVALIVKWIIKKT